MTFDTDKLVEGVNKLCDTLKITLGPCGHNVVIDTDLTTPIITNDGYTISKHFTIKDKQMNAGVEIAKNAISKTNDDAGEGRTTCAVLLQSILNNGNDHLKNIIGSDPIVLRNQIIEAKDEVVKLLKESSQECSDVQVIASTSSKSDYLGQIVAEVYKRVGVSGTVKIEDADQDSVSYIEGIEIDDQPLIAEDSLEDVTLMLFDKTLTMSEDLQASLAEKVKSGLNKFLIIANDFEDNVINWLELNKSAGNIKIIAVKASCFGAERTNFIEDLKALGSVVPKVSADKDKVILIGFDVEERVKYLKELKGETEFDKEKIKNRISRLQGKIAVIKVGAKTKIEQVEKRHHLQDAVNASRVALEEGTVKGGGLALLEASNQMSVETQGAKILYQSIREPFNRINVNGFKFTETEVVDPLKVVSSALENAVSVATSLLTTGAVMVEEEVKND